MGMYVSQLRSVPVGEYEYYVYLVDASEGAAHSPVIANALQGLAVQSGTVAVVVHGPGDLSMELFRFLQEQAPNDFSRLEHLFHETTALVISQGALQTTTSQVFVLPLLPASAVNSTHEELLSELVAQLLGAYAQGRVAEFCMSLGAEPMHLTNLRSGLLVRRPAGRDLPGIELPHLCDMIRACSHSCRCLYTGEENRHGRVHRVL